MAIGSSLAPCSSSRALPAPKVQVGTYNPPPFLHHPGNRQPQLVPLLFLASVMLLTQHQTTRFLRPRAPRPLCQPGRDPSQGSVWTEQNRIFRLICVWSSEPVGTHAT